MASPTKDPTFRHYTPAQARVYAAERTSYPRAIYDAVLDHHAATGGRFTTLLDVGCGPGNATRDLAGHFDRVVGVDPGAAMVEAARKLGGKTRTGEEVRFEVCAAEECASGVPGVREGEVDLIVAAMAAHWFDMSRFWPAAAKLLRPGGTVAFWTCASLYCHPTTPNAAALQSALFHLEHTILGPYETPPNRLSHDLYADLALPWSLSPPVPAFSPAPAHYTRIEWNRDGAQPDLGDEFWPWMTLEKLERGLATASMVTRWREANPEEAGTERDCVRVMVREVRGLLGGEDGFKGGMAVVVLLFKKLGEGEGVVA